MKRPRIMGAIIIGMMLLTASPAAFAQDDKNCSDFSSATELQAYVNSHPGDPSNLDGDNDGFYCETQFGNAVKAGGANTDGLATTGPASSTRGAEILGLAFLLVGLMLRISIRQPAKHRLSSC